jgi:hypothetical protein
MPGRHLLRRIDDAVGHLLVKRNEITRFGESRADRSRIGTAVLAAAIG